MLFDLLLKRLRERGLLKARGRQRTDSTHVLAAVRDLNRLELVGETVRPALNALAVAAPKWLSGFADPGWAARYERPLDEGRLPTGKEKRRVEAERIGENGSALLEAVGAEDAPRWLRELPAVETLRRMWLQNYLRVPGGDARWRRPVEDGLPPASERIDSPTDPESRRACKGRLSGGTAARWLGYKVHLTETCDDGMPRLVTHVETHTAPTPDQRTIPAAYEALEARKLLPHVHLVDMGYTDAAALLQAREGTEWTYWDRCGATTGDRPRGHRLRPGELRDRLGEARGHLSRGQEERPLAPQEEARRTHLRDRLLPRDCADYPSKDLCDRRNRSPGHGRAYRELTVASKEHYEALKIARQRAKTDGYAVEYARRQGMEGTVSWAVRACGLRRSRCRASRRCAWATRSSPRRELRKGGRVALWRAPDPRARIALRRTGGLTNAARTSNRLRGLSDAISPAAGRPSRAPRPRRSGHRAGRIGRA